MKKILAIVLAVALIVCCLAACGSSSSSSAAPAASSGSSAPAASGQTYELSFTIHDPATSAKTQLYQEMADKVAEETNGAVKITIYPSATLCAAKDVAEGIIADTADMGWLFTPFTPGQFGLTEVIMQPMVFSDPWANTQTIKQLYTESAELQAELANYKVLNIYSQPSNQLFSTKPITTAEDLQGLNIRTSSAVGTGLIGGWGASVMSYGPGDIYEAMNKNAIDAFTFEYSGVKSFKLYEVVDYAIEMPIFAGPFITAMNLDKWNALPAEYQEVLEKYFGWDLADQFARLFEEDSAAGKALCEEAGVEIVKLTAEQEATFKVAADAMIAEWVATNSANGFDAQGYYDHAVELYNAALADSNYLK